MEKSQKIIDICWASEALQKAKYPYLGPLMDKTLWVPTLHQLFEMLFKGEEGWQIKTSDDLYSFLSALEGYSLTHNITDFYELVLRFTLSERFGEETL